MSTHPLAGLVDDAAIFPPGLMPLPEAVRAHRGHRAAPHAGFVGPFVLTAAELAEAAGVAAELAATEYGDGPLDVSIVIGDAEAVADAVRHASELGMEVAAVEVKLDPAADLIAQLQWVRAQIESSVIGYLEAPRPDHPQWGDLCAAASSAGLRLKFRTGGQSPAAFPDEDELAMWIFDAVRHDAAFKCTAGLHNAARHTAPVTGFEHHGYLNVLLATARATRGADAAEVAAVLALTDADRLADALRTLPGAVRDEARASFRSYGSCSIAEPLADLRALGLYDHAAWETA